MGISNYAVLRVNALTVNNNRVEVGFTPAAAATKLPVRSNHAVGVDTDHGNFIPVSMVTMDFLLVLTKLSLRSGWSFSSPTEGKRILIIIQSGE